MATFTTGEVLRTDFFDTYTKSTVTGTFTDTIHTIGSGTRGEIKLSDFVIEMASNNTSDVVEIFIDKFLSDGGGSAGTDNEVILGTFTNFAPGGTHYNFADSLTGQEVRHILGQLDAVKIRLTATATPTVNFKVNISVQEYTTFS